MTFEQCAYCGEAFASGSSNLCPKCAKEMDGYFMQVKKYLYSTSGQVTSSNIVEALDIPEKAVFYLIDSGRLVSERKFAYEVKCKICGKPTTSLDQMCDSCGKAIRESFPSPDRKADERSRPDFRRINPLHRGRDE